MLAAPYKCRTYPMWRTWVRHMGATQHIRCIPTTRDQSTKQTLQTSSHAAYEHGYVVCWLVWSLWKPGHMKIVCPLAGLSPSERAIPPLQVPRTPARQHISTPTHIKRRPACWLPPTSAGLTLCGAPGCATWVPHNTSAATPPPGTRAPKKPCKPVAMLQMSMGM